MLPLVCHGSQSSNPPAMEKTGNLEARMIQHSHRDRGIEPHGYTLWDIRKIEGSTWIHQENKTHRRRYASLSTPPIPRHIQCILFGILSQHRINQGALRGPAFQPYWTMKHIHSHERNHFPAAKIRRTL